MTNKLAVRFFGILLIVFCGFFSTSAAPGDLDTTFAGTGFAREAGNTGSGDAITGVALQPDGKIVVVGRVLFNNLIRCGIVRYAADGSVDFSFDGDGRTIAQVGNEFQCHDVAIQNDGKIVVAGYVRSGSIYNVAVLRFNSDGSPDTSFDEDGRIISAFINGEFVYAVAIQADGKIVVAGNIGDDFLVVRYNPNGALDTSFDGDGWVSTDFFGGPDHARALTLQSDGKILVAGNGRAAGGSFNDFAVARYNPDGSLDTSFDGDGKVLTDISGNHDNAYDVAVHTDGKIVVGGYTWVANEQFGLVRYNANGSLDTTFNGSGKVTSDFTTYSDIVKDVAIQPDGKIVAVGYGSVGLSRFVIARYNTNGSLDPTFGANGRIITFVSDTEFDWANAVALQSDGKIVVGGINSGGLGDNVSFTSDFALMRLNSDGTFDTTFDGDGKVTANFYGLAIIQANDVAIQPDGKIVVVGRQLSANWESYENFAVNRYNPDGTLDASFDGDGKVVTDFGYQETAYAVAIQPDGKIVVVGGGIYRMMIARYNPDGSLDTSFSGDGKLIDQDNLSVPLALAVAVQPDGKILTAGATTNVEFFSAVFRYNADGSRDTSFDGDGKVTTNLGGNDQLNSIALQADGKIVVAGKAQNGASYDFSVIRYNSNGSTDTTFDGDGVVTIDFVGGYDNANDLAIQADGKIVVVGESNSDNAQQTQNYDSALARLNADGSLDTSFDGDGKRRVSLSNYFDTATGVVIQPDGKILTAGTAATILNNDPGTLENDFALVRYNSDGSFDQTYGTGGKAIINLFTNDLAYDLALDTNGRAVVAGETDGFFTVARIIGDATQRAPFDFDGDGKTDISIFRPSNGHWWYLRSSDGQARNFNFGSVGNSKISPADYNGDGKTDISFFRLTPSTWFILFNEGTGTTIFPFGAAGDTPAPGDFDGDGKADATVFRPSEGNWYIRRSSDGVTTVTTFGLSTDVPVTGDYDGDGKSDIAIYRPSLGQWWIQRSTAGLIVYQFGDSSDKPVQGDYTGDGKADVAVWRPSTGEWFVLRSEDLSYYAVPFGVSSDIPAPGDYDGDGRIDTAVFRPFSGTWYINRSTSGLLVTNFGINTDKPVPSAFVP